MFTVSEQCTEARTDLSDDSANVDLGCQTYNGHPDALLLGNLDGILDVAWITGGQASKEQQDLYSSMFLYTHFCKQSCPDSMLTVVVERLMRGNKPSDQWCVSIDSCVDCLVLVHAKAIHSSSGHVWPVL